MYTVVLFLLINGNLMHRGYDHQEFVASSAKAARSRCVEAGIKISKTFSQTTWVCVAKDFDDDE